VAEGDFNWTSLRPGLLRELRDELELGKRKPELVLAEAIGEPDDVFVKRTWPVLRDRWLATEVTARRAVVESLLTQHLGDISLNIGTAASDVAYLRSCSNSKALRTVVLAHLLAVGRPVPGASASKSPTGHPNSRAGKAAVKLADIEWQRFARSLALSLAQLELDQFLILEARRHPDYYVQFSQYGPAGLRGEAVSNQFLKDFERLGPQAEVRLRGLGWGRPGGDSEGAPDGPPNWHREWTLPVSYPDVAELAVSTMRHVYEVGAPAYLSYRAFHRSGAQIILPNLGIVRSEPEPATGVPAAATTEKSKPLTREDLLKSVRSFVADRIGVAEIQVDADGDIPLSSGTAQLYVRVLQDAPIVSVFGPVIWNIGIPTDVLETVNQMNANMRFARAFWNGKGILLSSEVLGDPLDRDELWNAVMVVAGLVAIHAPKLQERYGGAVSFGPALPPKQQPLGGYL
jgi:hypothetical protein